MHIACFIYDLIELSFLYTLLAQELGRDKDLINLAKKVKINIKKIKKIDQELDAQVTSLNGYIVDLGRQLNTTTEDLNGTVVEAEEKFAELNGAVINFYVAVTDLK